LVERWLRRKQCEKRDADDDEKSGADQEADFFAWNVKTESGHGSGVSEIRKSGEGDEATMRLWVANGDEQEDARVK